MMKIIDYCLICQTAYESADFLSFQQAIGTAIENGWQPWGVLSTSPLYGKGGAQMCQALVKYEDHDELEKLRAQVKALQHLIEFAGCHEDFAKIIIEQRTNGTNP